MNKLFQKNVFFCFTPEVTLATFLIELGLAIYVFFRYQMTAFGRIVVFILLLLAGFQLAEFQVCNGVNPIFWSRIGFVIITFLPVLGLRMVALVTGKSHFLKFGYVLMAVYILIFAFAPKAINGAICGGNYIIFHTEQKLSWTYTAYYFGFLLLGIWEAIENISFNNKIGTSDVPNIEVSTFGHRKSEYKNLLLWIIVGYGSFMIPMGIVYSLSPATRDAIPSVMCGFALILAFILAFKIAPKYTKIYAVGR